MYGAAIVIKQQLEDIGITVDFRVTDWATVLENRAKKDAWEMFVTGHGFVPDPSQVSYVGQMNVYPGWWSSESSLALAADLALRVRLRHPLRHLGQIQTAHYTEIPAIKIGDSSTVSFRSDTARRLGCAVRARSQVLELLDQGVTHRRRLTDGGMLPSVRSTPCSRVDLRFEGSYDGVYSAATRPAAPGDADRRDRRLRR